MKKLIVIISFLAAFQAVSAQDIVIKTNLIYAATLTPNIGMEFRLGEKMTLDLRGSYNPWNLNGTANSNKKLVHWMTLAEVRRWITEEFDGHFLGIHGLFARYNIGQQKGLDLLLGWNSERYRFEGYAAGGGLSYGYLWKLGDRWMLEASIGVGLAFMDYDQYECRECGSLVDSAHRIYFGPTRFGLNIAYVIK